MAQRGGGKKTACQFENACQSSFVSQLINCWAADHSFDSHLRSYRRNLNGIAVFESLDICLHSVKQEIVNVDSLHQLVAVIVLQNSQRSARRRSSRNE